MIQKAAPVAEPALKGYVMKIDGDEIPMDGMDTAEGFIQLESKSENSL